MKIIQQIFTTCGVGMYCPSGVPECAAAMS